MFFTNKFSSKYYIWEINGTPIPDKIYISLEGKSRYGSLIQYYSDFYAETLEDIIGYIALDAL